MAGSSDRLGSWRIVAAAVLLSVGAALLPCDAHAQTVELLMFEEPGCPYCRRWRAEVGPGYPLSAEGKRAPLRVIAMTDALPPGLRLSSPIRYSPTFVLVENGREVGRINGYPGADFFWSLLDGLMAKLAVAPAQPPRAAIDGAQQQRALR